MDLSQLGIIGGGRVARILLGGWQRAGQSVAGVVVSDWDAGVRERLPAEFPTVRATGDNRAAAAQPIVFCALHPPAFAGALSEIREGLKPETLFVSLAPKWTMSRICGALGGFDRLARVIPNAPSIVNQGYNPVCFSTRVAATERSRLLELFAPLGACPEVPEDTLEAYAIVAAMGPTYLWYQLYELLDLGVEFGLSRACALEAVAMMAEGTTATMGASGMPPEEVIDLIPVKPMAPHEEGIRRAYAETLRGLHAKLKA